MMNNFKKSLDEMLALEFSTPSNALHKNKGENGLAFMGIYETAFPKWKGWELIKKYLNLWGNLQRTSQKCYSDEVLREFVAEFYKVNFWDKMSLDEIKNEKIAGLIFKFGVNVGTKRAVKFAQDVAGVKADTVIGKETINALNKLDSKYFEREYKAKFIKFYKDLAKKNPKRYAHFFEWVD